jgi:peptidoglycan/xylan/chitin deacetylase (PgdA/CDA1 family)
MSGNLAMKAALNALYFSGAQAVASYWLCGLGAIIALQHVHPGRGGRFSPNAFHTVAPEFLDRLLEKLVRRNVTFISLVQLADRLRVDAPRSLDEPFVAFTLDVGYRDAAEHAIPLFRKFRAPYTLFVAPGFVEGTATPWWEDLELVIAQRNRFYLPSPNGSVAFDCSSSARKYKAYRELSDFLATGVGEEEQRGIVRALAEQCRVDLMEHSRRLFLSWRELRTLSADPLCTIGSHGLNHYALARLDERKARQELVESRRIIEMELGEPPRYCAYPYGTSESVGARDFGIARNAGYEFGLTTRPGPIYQEHREHPLALPRIALDGTLQAARYVETLLSGLPARLRDRGKRLDAGLSKS